MIYLLLQQAEQANLQELACVIMGTKQVNPQGRQSESGKITGPWNSTARG